MEEGNNEKYNGKKNDEIFSKAVRAGKRTYFFDVKATRGNDYYLTITESKKRFGDDGKFTYEKHKIFLYKEDFEKFSEGLNEVIAHIKQNSPETPAPAETKSENNTNNNSASTDISFEDLGK